MQRDDGGPAFPLNASDSWGGPNAGMTLRDWFAGQALAAAWDARDKGYYEGDNNDMAKCAYQIADAMIEARSK